jgi:uroporphyrinogen decarboxylase
MMTMTQTLLNMAREKYAQGKRLVVPLMGFPGVQVTGSSIKLAQQNPGEHFKVINELAERFSPDMIFPLMDLAVEANALGRYTIFPKDESATVPKDHFGPEQMEGMRDINISLDTRLLGYIETMKIMKVGLSSHITRGAYVTGPYTLAGLLMGADDAAMATMINPDELNRICRFATERIQEYIHLLISAGAEAICILEPTAVMLGPDHFREFSARYVEHLVKSTQYSGVATIYHTCGNTMHLVGKMAESGVSGVSLDAEEFGVDLPEVARNISEDVVVIGNISPVSVLLNGTPELIRDEVGKLLEQMAPFPNFILSTGCDLPQETPLENIEAFMEAGRAGW